MDTIKTITDKARRMSNGKEGAITEGVEKVTSQLPSITWLVLAGGALAGSLTLKLMGREKSANFVGQWVPTILLLGIYNKLVKVVGSDRNEAQRSM